MRMKTYFGVSAVATFARVLPQAVLTPILLSKGLQYDAIIWTQIVYMVTLTLAEFPSGLMADRFSRKKLYVGSVLVFASAYGIVWFGESLVVMCVAWAVYALGTALNSSTMDIHFATMLRDDDRSFRRFFVLDHNVVLAATILGALATTLLYPLIGVSLYAVSVVCFVVVALIGALVLPKTPIVREAEKTAPPKVVSALRRDPWLVLVVVLFALTQLAFTPFFQMWQMVLLDGGLGAEWFGPIFIAFQLITIAANAAWARLAHRNSVSFILLGIIAVIGACTLWSENAWTIAVVMLIPFPLFLYSNSLGFSLQSRAPAALMSSINALMGTASTIGALAALAICLVGLKITTSTALLGCSLIVFSILSVGVLTLAVARRLGPEARLEQLRPVDA